ncbi:hypothetical protein [Undibacterium sp. Ji22W]|uniref:hypothetical protein n=1 Tax=Undibacterium sp. Ji22W TaxID=3413038 RepID=UPI003BF229A7
MENKPPEIYWVVATHTNAGKTTLAAALIRVLNALGCPTVGFKPFAGMRLRDGVDFLSSQSRELNHRMAFSDGALLSQASPLTAGEYVDVVVPRQLIFKDSVRDTFLLRTGSQTLHNVEVWTNEQGQALAKRADVAYLIEKMNLPFAQARILEPIARPRSAVGREKAEQAFAYLKTWQPQAIVCEGAGPWLPVWQDQACVNHVFMLTADSLHFYRDADLQIDVRNGVASDVGKDEESNYALAPDYKILLKALQAKGIQSRMQPYWILDSSRREAVIDAMLQGFLSAR